MLGAIIGDLAGSIYEFDQMKEVKKIKVKKLIEDNAFFSDDTILTMAIADAIINRIDYGKSLRKWTKKYASYRPNFEPYFKTTFSPNYTKWAASNTSGNSLGNGAMMRISPVGEFFESEEEVVRHAQLATIPSHNTEEAVQCATTIALIIFYARQGLSKEEIISKLDIKLKRPHIEKFNYTCSDTIDVCLYSIFTTDNFEDAIRKAISYGGDTDTNACIVGSMAEAMYGIADTLKQKVYSILPIDMIQVLNAFYDTINARDHNHEL